MAVFASDRLCVITAARCGKIMKATIDKEKRVAAFVAASKYACVLISAIFYLGARQGKGIDYEAIK